MSAKTKAQLLADIEALKKGLAKLQAVKAEPHQKNGVSKKQAHALVERVKELECLYGISRIVETPGISMPEILQGCVELLPPAWQYPQTTCARIMLDNKEYKTGNFRKTKWKLASEIKVEGKRAGTVEVFCLEEQPKEYEGPFLKEEHALINAVAERLGRIIQRVMAQERIEHLNHVLRAIRDVNQLIVREKNRAKLIREVCSTLTETRGYSTAWIMLLDERGEYFDSAASGLGKGFTSLQRELKQGKFPACMQRAQSQPGPAEINDPSSTCAGCPITDIYSDKGRVTSLLKHDGTVYGVLSISFGIDLVVDDEELSLIKEVAGDIAFAMHSTELGKKNSQIETRFRLAANAGSDLIYEWGLKNNNLEWFGGIDEHLGYEPGTIPRTIEGWVNLIHPDDVELLEDSVEHHRTSTELIMEEYRVRQKNGAWRHWVDRGLPVLDEEGKPIKWIGVCIDVTETKRAEKIIQEERDKAQEYLDIAEVIFITLNKKGQVTLVNNKGNQILGYHEDELIGKSWFDTCIPEQSRKEVRQVFKKIMAGELELTKYYENHILTRSGEERIIAWHNTSLSDEKQNIIGTLSSGEDITERIQSEEQIKSLSKFPDENPNPVLRFSEDGKILYASHSSAPLLTKWGKTVGENAPPDWKKKIINSFSSGENQEFEAVVEDRIFSFILTPIKDMGYVNAYGRDISEQKQSEEEIQALNAELEARVVERTAQLEAANHELESFTYSVSHDLRAPLRAMSGFSNILVEEYGEQLPKEAQRFLDLIEDNSHKMGSLIDDLLLFSRTGKQALDVQKVNCTGIVEQTLADLQVEQNDREIEVVVGKLPACRADPALIKQVFINLLSNAFKFTKGKKKSRVEISSKIIKGETVYFVKDNGAGFDMRYADKLFGVFQRLHSTADFEGTGVGLAIVQRIIQRHGGKVWAEAEIDKGAIFYFTVGENDEN